MCGNCTGRHPSYNRDCPAFVDKCAQQDARCPENNLAFYPTDEPWTWVTVNSYTNFDTQYQENEDTWHPGNRTCFLTGANTTTPDYHPLPTGAQPHQLITQ